MGRAGPRRKVQVGQKYGRLTVTGFREKNTRGNLLWNCLCDCGTTRVVAGSNLLSGCCASCGCYKAEELAQRNYRHGGAATPEYSIWLGMRQRCNNPTSDDYTNYGGRGITICNRWKSFSVFLADMGERPSEKHTIERIDNHGPYSPENCIWATCKVQANNKRNVPRYTYKGKTKSVAEWAEEYRIHPETLRSRLNGLGWTLERALQTPPRHLSTT